MSNSIARRALPGKRKTIIVLSIAEFLSMSVWFSASAVVPVLTTDWHLSGAGQAWLTMSVQIGFVIGAFASSFFNLADYFAGQKFFTATSFLAALTTALIPLVSVGLRLTLILRFLTGVFLAGVYPVGMKIIATWTKEDRGLGIGLLVGALTLGSAASHLINAFDRIDEWRPVLYSSATLAAIGGLLTFLFVQEGPYRVAMPKFNWKYVGQIFRKR
ncbi:MAG TPA: MFS transporter, partial [Sedimentisphaerales bacterium]